MYSVTIYLLLLVARFLALFHVKLQKAFALRRGLKSRMQEIYHRAQGKPLWVFHGASVGELEQSYAVIEPLRRLWREQGEDEPFVLLTFFSPSAYTRAQKLCQGEDFMAFMPLPWDTPAWAQRFAKLLSPKFFVSASYDIWPNLVWSLQQNKTKLFLVSALLASSSGRIKGVAFLFYRRLYSYLDKVYPVDDDTAERFHRLLPHKRDKIKVMGDTRCDAIEARLKDGAGEESAELQALDNWLAKKAQTGAVFLAGSTYSPCDEVLLAAIKRVWQEQGLLRVVYVPHETGPERLKNLREALQREGLGFAFLSEMVSTGSFAEESPVVVVDRVGLLLLLYQRADFVFVGGSFYTKIHNTYEPAAWGKALAFGPKYHNAPEAERLVRAGGATVLSDSQEAYQWLSRLARHKKLRQSRGRINKEIFVNNLKASHNVARDMLAHLL